MKAIRILEEIRRLKKQNTRLAVRTIILTADLRVIADDPTSDRAKEIIARYRKQNDIEREIEQASKN